MEVSGVRLTPQKWEGAVLQLHDDSVQNRQHWRDVQQDQDDGLMGEHAAQMSAGRKCRQKNTQRGQEEERKQDFLKRVHLHDFSPLTQVQLKT